VNQRTFTIAAAVLVAANLGAAADDWTGCGGPDLDRRIASCTRLIETDGIDPALRAEAFARRGYAYLQRGQYQRAIQDNDDAIRIAPRHLAALNNRAMAYIRLGQPAKGQPDVELAMTINPRHPPLLGTRGYIRQSLGDRQGAISDHTAAMTFGGAAVVRFYQCGLRLAQLYHGPVDGVVSPELHAALGICVDQGIHCDAAKPDPECPQPVG
jgi:tetratricopeptide (TPR) repeat protein